MSYTVEMKQFNFEHANNGDNRQHNFTHEEMKVRLTVDEIRGQLESETYAEALKKLKAGNESDREYLVDYQGNLVDWVNDIIFFGGTQRSGNEEVLAEVKRRFVVVSEALGAQKEQEDSDKVLH